MFDRDRWLEILQMVVRNPVRTLLSGLGVSWGVFMLIVMFSASKGLENGMRSDLANRAENSAFMWTMPTSLPYKGFQKGRRFELTMADVDYLKQNVPEIDMISPRSQLGGYRGSNNVVRGNKTGAFNLYGDFPEYINVQPVLIAEGRYLNHGDIEEQRKICVIGDRVRQVLFDFGEPTLGENISVNGVNFKVVGVYKSKQKGEDADEEESSIFVPFSTFQKAFNVSTVGWLSVLSKADVPVSFTEDKIVSMLKELHSVHPDDPRAVGSWNMQEKMEEMTMVFSGLEMFVGFIGILVLLAGAIGICNIMLITVRERTKEFGIRRALGASPATIIKQVVLETLFLMMIAGLGGLALGVGALELLNMSLDSLADSGSFRDPSIDLKTVLMALSVLFFSGLLFSLLPAYRAVSVKPVDAIREEG